jgi:hypothetical protein
MAHEALRIEDKVGTVLPCNVVVQAREDGSTEVAAIDPLASMQAIENPRLAEAASEVRQRLSRVIQALEGQAATAQIRPPLEHPSETSKLVSSDGECNAT